MHPAANNLLIRPAAGSDLRALRARLAGSVAVYGDAYWDHARQAWNLAVDQRPVAVVHAVSAEDVVAVLEFARVHGYSVAPQGTGHNAAPLGPLDDTILLKTSRMRGVEIDPETQTARVEAGALWADVTSAASTYGLAALAGSAADVGVVGYTLGGGIGWLSRKHGFAANSVTAVELVTADGRLVRADRENEPDLFWAVRGGGGSFGIVTALELGLYPIETVYAGALFFPAARAEEVLGAWREWAQDAPDDMTSVARIIQFPTVPNVPTPLRGNSYAIVEAAYVGGWEPGSELIRPLRALGSAMDTFATTRAVDLQRLHMDPDGPVPGAGNGGLLADVTPDAIEALASIVPRSPLVSVELRQLGGALARPRAEHGALASVDAGFAWFAVGPAPSPDAKEAVEAHVDEVGQAFARWDAGVLSNFAQRPFEARRAHPEHVFHRLRRIKSQVDPSGLIRANHPIPAAV
jgi:FAD/FMN-containing dehydrogenase